MASAVSARPTASRSSSAPRGSQRSSRRWPRAKRSSGVLASHAAAASSSRSSSVSASTSTARAGQRQRRPAPGSERGRGVDDGALDLAAAQRDAREPDLGAHEAGDRAEALRVRQRALEVLACEREPVRPDERRAGEEERGRLGVERASSSAAVASATAVSALSAAQTASAARQASSAGVSSAAAASRAAASRARAGVQSCARVQLGGVGVRERERLRRPARASSSARASGPATLARGAPVLDRRLQAPDLAAVGQTLARPARARSAARPARRRRLRRLPGAATGPRPPAGRGRASARPHGAACRPPTGPRSARCAAGDRPRPRSARPPRACGRGGPAGSPRRRRGRAAAG